MTTTYTNYYCANTNIFCSMDKKLNKYFLYIFIEIIKKKKSFN